MLFYKALKLGPSKNVICKKTPEHMWISEDIYSIEFTYLSQLGHKCLDQDNILRCLMRQTERDPFLIFLYQPAHMWTDK